jgi:hypothetical protein
MGFDRMQVEAFRAWAHFLLENKFCSVTPLNSDPKVPD